MKDVSCDVIQDLLPLYADSCCSESSKLLVEEHLNGCDACRQQLHMMKADIMPIQPINKEQEAQVLGQLAKAWYKSKKLSWIMGSVVATILCVGLVMLYIGLTQWYVVAVAPKDIEISEVYQLANGNISYRLKTKDGYEINKMVEKSDNKGIVYIQAYRSVIRKKVDGGQSYYDQLKIIDKNIVRFFSIVESSKLENGEPIVIDILNAANEQDPSINIDGYIKKVYYGTEEDSILIWSEGMELPPASEELELYWKNKYLN